MKRTARVAAAALSACAAAHADDIVWINPLGGSWHHPANWSPPKVPGEFDRALFNLNAAYTVSLAPGGGQAAAASLLVSAGDVTLDLQGATLQLDGSDIWFINAGQPAPTLTVTAGTVTAGPIHGDAAARALLVIDDAYVGNPSGVDISGVNVLVVNGSTLGGGSSFDTLADGSVTIDATSTYSTGAFGFDMTGDAAIYADGGYVGGDGLGGDPTCTIELINGAFGSWMSTGFSGRVSVRSGSSFIADVGGFVADLHVDGPGSTAGNIWGGVLVSNGGELALNGYPFGGTALVTGPGSRIRTWGYDGDVHVTDGGVIAGDFGELSIYGDVRISGPGSTFADAPDLYVEGTLRLSNSASGEASTARIRDKALLRVESGASLSCDALLADGSVAAVGTGSTIVAPSARVEGILAVRSGAAIQTDLLEIVGGRLFGDGAIDGDVDLHGSGIEPALSDDPLTIAGTLRWRSPAAFLISEVEYNRHGRVVAAAVELDGGLRLDPHPFYGSPEAGDTWVLVNATAISGHFRPDMVSFTGLHPGLRLRVNYTAGAVAAEIYCAADFDESGSLSTADFAAFRTAYLASDPRCDLNNSGGVDTGDFAAFRAAYLAGCP